MSAMLHAPRRTPARLCALTVALINAGPIAQAAEVPSYCTELKQVAALALTRDKFASIIGDEGIAAHRKVFDEVKSCLHGSWTDVESRASPGYVVLHDEKDSASITINTDLTDKGEHIVRLILFLRSRSRSSCEGILHSA